MRVELVVRHSGATDAELGALLGIQFGPDDPSSLHASQMGQVLAGSSVQPLFSRATPENRLIAWAPSTDELQFIIEPVNGRVDPKSFDRVWLGIQKALQAHAPTLGQATQVDEPTGQPLQSGYVGVTAEAKQKEIYLPLVIAAVSLAWTFTGIATFVTTERLKFFGGSVAAITGGVVALVLLVINTRRRRIRWTGTP